jgi:hypothetical protein
MTETKKARRIGRPPKSGAYSLTYQDEFLGTHPELRNYLLDMRAGWVRCLGPTEEDLSAQRACLIDRALNILKRIRVIEGYLDKYGLLNRAALEKKRLEAEPILTVYSTLNNSLVKIMSLLGMDKLGAERTLTLDEYMVQKDRAREVAGKGPSVDCGARSDDGEANDADNSDAPTGAKINKGDVNE